MMIDKVHEAVMEAGSKPLPYAARIKMSLLLGAKLDPSLSSNSLQTLQGMFAAPDQPETDGQVSAGKPINTAKSTSGMASEAQRLQGM
jgi:hypothetical protein